MSCILKHVFCLLSILIFAITKSEAVFEGCDYTYNITAGVSTLESPYYPSTYPASTSCRYNFVAPLDHYIEISCSLKLPQSGTSCSTDFFYLSTDGDKQLRGSEQFCGAGNFQRNSLFRSAVLAYISNGGRGSFRCTLNTKPQPCDCGWYSNSRIVNGVQANINQYPSMAYLSQRNSGQPLYCGAIIISHYYALTAGHCELAVADKSTVTLNVGDHDVSSSTETPYAAKYGVKSIVKHPNYQQNPNRHDIAIITTTSAIEWSRGVGPICLPTVSTASNTYAYSYVDVAGWGTKFLAGPLSNTLQKVTLMILENTDCQSIYSTSTIFPEQICTYDYTGNRKDSCQFDSGSPVIRLLGRQLLVGLVSWGEGCGQTPYATGVNTRISPYLNWIYQSTGYSTCNINM